jgi:16S rRNA processing protein RimM
MSIDAAEPVTIGRIIKPFGVRGEFHVRSLTDVPGRFRRLRSVTLVAPSGRTIQTTVSRVREAPGSLIVGVEALSTPEEAAVFRGGWMKIPEDQTPPLPEGHYYQFQLIGMAVQDEAGRMLGTLEEIFETGSHPVLVVRGHGREMMIPGVPDAIVTVNLNDRVMTIRSEAGIWDDDAH